MFPNIGSFDSRIVEIVEVVHTDDFIVPIEKLINKMRTNEARTSGHQNHGEQFNRSEGRGQTGRSDQWSLFIRREFGLPFQTSDDN